MRRLLAHSLFLFFVAAGFALPVQAENPNAARTGVLPADQRTGGFFERDVVRDVFGEELQMGEAPEYEFFPRQPEKVKPVPREAAVAAGGTPGAKASATPAAQLQTAMRKSTGKDPVADSLVAKYGDPSKDAPIQAIESAPTPFKGIMAALQENRDDLAMMYARQYVRHFKNLQDRTRKVMGMTKAAIELDKDQPGTQLSPEEQAFMAQDGGIELQPPQAVDPREEKLEEDAKALALIERIRNGQKPVEEDAEAFSFAPRINGQGEAYAAPTAASKAKPPLGFIGELE